MSDVHRDLDVSVVIPFFNEEENIAPLFDELVPLLKGQDRSWEIVAVDDGSGDGTRDALRAARARHGDALRVLGRDRNAGQSAAFRAGFAAARGTVIATLDGDMQIDPRDLLRLLRHRAEHDLDMVHGWRKVRRDSGLKRLSTRIANGVRNRLTGETIRDTGCPLKVMRREVTEAFPPFDGMHRFYVTLAHMAGFRTEEVEVNHRPRAHGTSKYGIRNRLGRALRDCLAIRWMQRRHLGERAAVQEFDDE